MTTLSRRIQYRHLVQSSCRPDVLAKRRTSALHKINAMRSVVQRVKSASVTVGV